MSPRRQVIVCRHFRPVPIFGEGAESVSEVGGLVLVDTAMAKVAGAVGLRIGNDDAGTLGLIGGSVNSTCPLR
jgi:hypothetical protein